MHQCDYCNYESLYKCNVDRHEAKKHTHELNQVNHHPGQVHRPWEEHSTVQAQRQDQVPMISNHSQEYVGGTEGQFQFRLKSPKMHGNENNLKHCKLIPQIQYLQNKVNELQRENMQLLENEYASKKRKRSRPNDDEQSETMSEIDSMERYSHRTRFRRICV